MSTTHDLQDIRHAVARLRHSGDIYVLPELCRNRLKPIPTGRGVHQGFSRWVYDQLPYISNSVLKAWDESDGLPSKFGYWLEHRWDAEKSEALLLGSALDAKLLEPARFPDLYCTVPPDAPKRPSKAQRNAGKPSPATLQAIGFWNKFEEENITKDLLTSDQMLRIVSMEAAIRKAPCATGIFDYCQKTVLIGEFNGWTAKAEVDLWNDNAANSHIIDLKTCADAGTHAFGAACDKFGYIRQAVFYLSLANSLGIKKTAFSWCVVESEAPYTVAVYAFDPENIEKHRVVYDATLEHLKEAHRLCTYQLLEGAYVDDPDWKPVELPEWTVARARKQLET